MVTKRKVKTKKPKYRNQNQATLKRIQGKVNKLLSRPNKPQKGYK